MVRKSLNSVMGLSVPEGWVLPATGGLEIAATAKCSILVHSVDWASVALLLAACVLWRLTPLLASKQFFYVTVFFVTIAAVLGMVLFYVMSRLSDPTVVGSSIVGAVAVSLGMVNRSFLNSQWRYVAESVLNALNLDPQNSDNLNMLLFSIVGGIIVLIGIVGVLYFEPTEGRLSSFRFAVQLISMVLAYHSASTFHAGLVFLVAPWLSNALLDLLWGRCCGSSSKRKRDDDSDASDTDGSDSSDDEGDVLSSVVNSLSAEQAKAALKKLAQRSTSRKRRSAPASPEGVAEAVAEAVEEDSGTSSLVGLFSKNRASSAARSRF
jgi:hypothetical protein